MVCAGITYDAGDNQITVEYNATDGTKGASFSNPYTMQDIYDTDIANGWGVITKLDAFYYLTAYLLVQGTDVYFKAENEYIKSDQSYLNDVFIHGCYAYIVNCSFYSVTNKSVRIANVQDGSTVSGNQIINGNRPGYSQLTGTTPLNASIYTDGRFFYIAGITTTITNTILKNMGFIVYGAANFDNVTVLNTTYGLYIAATGDLELTFKNCIFDGVTNLAYAYIRTIIVLNIIDCKTNTYNVAAAAVSDGINTFNIQTTFNAAIENASGGELTIEDKDGNVIYSETLTTEEMTESIINHRQLEYVSLSNELTETINIYSPFTLKVTKAGYQDLVIPDITVTAGQPTTVYGKLEPIKYVNNELTGQVEAAQVTGQVEAAQVTGQVE